MLTYATAFMLALGVALTLTPLVAAAARRGGLLDMPNQSRKVHTRPVPRLGGIAVVTAFFAPIVGLAIYTNDISSLLYADVPRVVALFAGALAIVALGAYDDLSGGAAATRKFLVQTAVAIGMWFAGFRIDVLGNPLGQPIALGALSLPLTVLWIVGVVNALNLIDGLDGLAAGISIFTCVALFGVALAADKTLLCLFTAALGGALLGFLFFNSNPATIFLGDSGSMFLGFVLASVSIWTQHKSATAAALLIPLLALGVPILDTTLAIVRRLLRRQSPFRADREHVHHRLLALGLSHRSAVMMLYTASGVLALGALALLDNDTTRRTIALSTMSAVLIFLVRGVMGFFGTQTMSPFAAPASLTLRDEARAAARAIRCAPTVAHAWEILTRVLSRRDCQEIRLAIEATAAPADRAKKAVYHWRRASAQRGRLDHATFDGATIRMPLGEADERFGELAVLLTEHFAHTPARRACELVVELLADALIDFQIFRREGDGLTAPRIVPSERVAPPSVTPSPAARGALTQGPISMPPSTAA